MYTAKRIQRGRTTRRASAVLGLGRELSCLISDVAQGASVGWPPTRVPDATGVDASPAMIEIARERVPEGRFHVGDMQVLPFDENEFDVVTAFNSLQFTDDPCAALVGARRVAKPGAIVFSVVFGREERVGQVAGWRALGTSASAQSSGFPRPNRPL